MGECRFRFDFPGSASELIERIDDAIREAGGDFEGNASAGVFSLITPLGPIDGNYVIEAQSIGIVVTRKPGLLSCRLMESRLLKYIESASS